MTTPKVEVELVQTFRFAVLLTPSPSPGSPKIEPLGNGHFAECSGLELEADVREYLEGGRNDGVVRRVGRVKLVPIVLKRGMFVVSSRGGANSSGGGANSSGDHASTELWDWLTGMVSGQLPIPRYDGMVQVLEAKQGSERGVARWTFTRGLPNKVTGPSLNAKTGEIAIEELHIVHEGLRLEKPSQTQGANP
jgi:phage tail-like protein